MITTIIKANIYYLLCVRYYVGCFTYILPFNHHGESVALVLHPFYRWGDWDLETGNDLCKFTQWVNEHILEVTDSLSVRERWNKFIGQSLSHLALEIKGSCQEDACCFPAACPILNNSGLIPEWGAGICTCSASLSSDRFSQCLHRLNGHESQQTPGAGEGQKTLVCCSPWVCKKSYMTKWFNNT